MNTELSKQSSASPDLRRQEYVRPYYEVNSSESAFEVKVYLPGVARDQASITLEKDNLMVEAYRSAHWTEGSRVVHREIPTADYRLNLQLNIAVDENQISAESKNGVLTIHLPVAEEAKPRQIRIK